jgi:hypothetical protein
LASAVGGALPAGGGGHGGVWVIFDVQVLSRVFGRHGRAGIVVDRALHRHGRPLVEMTDSNDVTNSRLVSGRQTSEAQKRTAGWQLPSHLRELRRREGARNPESVARVVGEARRGGFEAVRARALERL